MSKIKIVEPPETGQDDAAERLFLWCGCEYGDECPQGKPIGSKKCLVPIERRRLKNKEVKRLLSDRR